MFITKCRKIQQCTFKNFFIWFTTRYSDKWTWICTKMAQCDTMGNLWGDFITFVLRKIIYKGQFMFGIKYQNTMFWCGVGFQSIPLHIVYNFQHFESIEYDNGVPRFFHAFEPNDPKVT
jgi:hypothetical protein